MMSNKPDYTTDDWAGCYDHGWQNIITPEAFAHPAKFSHGLIRKIYQHAIEEGWLQAGDTVVDPFGGVALGGLYAMKAGLNWVGVELEQKFVDLGNQNIELWNERFGIHWPDWGTAALLQGDSRQLTEVLAGARVVLGSPPYSNDTVNNRNGIDADKFKRPGGKHSQAYTMSDYGQSPGQLANLPEGDPQAVIASPPFAGNSGGRGQASREGIDADLFDRHSGGMVGGMGDSPDNLGNLRQGDVGAAIGSPSYADGCRHQGGDDPNPEHIEGGKQGAYGVAVVGSPPFVGSVGSDDPDKRGGLYRDPKRRNDKNLTGTYGATEGQLGGMVEGVIGSPPYEGSINAHQAAGDYECRIERMAKAGIDTSKSVNVGGKNSGYQHNLNYGKADGQIGAIEGPTFWTAALTIVQQCYQILPSGAMSIWVVKDFVRNKKRVEFSEQWRLLCESVGFRTLHVHRAWLVKYKGVQRSFDGEDVELVTERKSFFRRLAEKNGSPRIDWETVLCMVRE